MIKAIQTRYAGYFFRSRLEARWAVFFDALKLDWQYEPEGFELPSGDRYLPDFRINLRNKILWVDVKPPGAGCPEIAELMKQAPANWVGTVLHDIPDPRKPYHGNEVWFSGEGWDDTYCFCVCRIHDEVGFEFGGAAERIGCCHSGPFWDEDRITNAFAQARAARFEHEARERYGA